MQYKKSLVASALVTTSLAAYAPKDPWSTLTPSATYKGGITDYSSTFGIAVEPIATTASSKAKRAAAISQIGDGQIQATTNTTVAPVSQITDGQIQATTLTSATIIPSPAPAPITNGTDPVTAETCKSSGTLEMNLKGGILTDGKGRIGSIVANRQFQFDGPPPQDGAIYAAGWSITPEGNLAIGDQDTFYQCLSGNFYNLYDEHIGTQCNAVHLQAIDLVNC